MRVFRHISVAWMLLSAASSLAIDLPNPLSMLTGDRSETAAALLKDIDFIAAPGEVGTLCVYGTNAEVIVTAPYSREEPAFTAAIMAAGTIGGGRVVVFPHTGYLDIGSFENNDTFPMLINCIKWAAGGKEVKNPRIKTVDNEELADMLTGRGIDAANLDPDGWTAKIDESDVIICTADFDTNTARALENYAAAGKGIICAMTGWAWPGDIPGRTMREMPANYLLGPAGIAFTADSVPSPPEGKFPTKSKDMALVHTATAIKALDEIISDSSKTNDSIASSAISLIGKAVTLGRQVGKSESRQIIKAVSSMYDCAPAAFSKEYRKAVSEMADKTKLTVTTISRESPVKNDAISERCIITINSLINKATPVSSIKASPFASQFPGSVPASAARITKEISMNTGVPGWHSTGLYAAPGEKIKIVIPSQAGKAGFKALIGCHTDDLWDCEEWHRMPSITRQFNLVTGTNTVANEFGGLIYIDIPQESAIAGTMKFKFAGACKAPYFRMGIDKPEEWKRAIRNNPAPWAELATAKLIITVPSSSIRKLDDPEPVLRFWDSVMDAIADLAVIPRARKYPERIVHDIEPGAGYMHSGYPIVAPTDAAPEMFDLAALKKNGSWGYFHELGHNHQESDWTFDGTDEVTENLFCLYILEKVCSGISPEAHENLAPQVIKENTEKHIKSGAKFEDWKADAFLGLIMYMQLKDAFGWDTYKKVFAGYRKIPEDRRPQSDADKRDEWLVRFSTESGKNLAKFFEYWGIPISDQAKDKVKELPSWMPAAAE